MPSIQQIVDHADRLYPNEETDANKVYDLDRLHKRVYIHIQRLVNDESFHADVTIADQLTYTLPSNCRIENVNRIQVSKEEITDDNETTVEWDTFEYTSTIRNIDTGNWYGRATSTTYALVQDGEPINEADLSIRIFYYKRPEGLDSSNMAAIPELDQDYHDLLVWGLVQELASQGQNPDTEIADYYQRKYDEFLHEIETSLVERMDKAPVEEERLEDRW